LKSFRDVLFGERDSVAFWGLLIAAVAALAVLVTLTLGPRRSAEPLEVRASPFPFGEMPPLAPQSPAEVIPIPMEPLPSTAPPADGQPPKFAVADGPTGKPPSNDRPSPSKSSKPPKPPWVAWLDKPAALEAAGRPGMLLRHRDFVAQLDFIGSGSRPLDRADATFVVREGLAGDGCLSFESANYDGFYLRHHDFLLRLARNDRTPLFRQDATFCPERSADGTLTLRALNFTDRRLALQWNRVTLAPVPASKALHIRLRPPP